MIFGSALVFFISFTLIVALFALKQWEFSRGREVAPALRSKLDSEAIRMKELVVAGRSDIEKLPPILAYAIRRILHSLAVDFGHLAHALGTEAHRLADAVSYKRNFTQRETRSEFLKKVSEGKAPESNSTNERLRV